MIIDKKEIYDKAEEFYNLVNEYKKYDENMPYEFLHQLNVFANYIKTKLNLNNEVEIIDDVKFKLNKSNVIPEQLQNCTFKAIIKKDDFDNHYSRCFDCAMHINKRCLKQRGLNIPECNHYKRADGLSLIFIKD